MTAPPQRSTLFPYATLFRSGQAKDGHRRNRGSQGDAPVVVERGGSDDPVIVDDSTREDGKQDEKHRGRAPGQNRRDEDRKSTRLNSSHVRISYAVFCLQKKK